MSKPAMFATYWFDSTSGDKVYQTLHYVDGTTSCECMGWTRRVDKNGNRSCKHTRLVEAGLGPTYASTFHYNHTVLQPGQGTPAGGPTAIKALPILKLPPPVKGVWVQAQPITPPPPPPPPVKKKPHIKPPSLGQRKFLD